MIFIQLLTLRTMNAKHRNSLIAIQGPVVLARNEYIFMSLKKQDSKSHAVSEIVILCIFVMYVHMCICICLYNRHVSTVAVK